MVFSVVRAVSENECMNGTGICTGAIGAPDFLIDAPNCSKTQTLSLYLTHSIQKVPDLVQLVLREWKSLGVNSK